LKVPSIKRSNTKLPVLERRLSRTIPLGEKSAGNWALLLEIVTGIVKFWQFGPYCVEAGEQAAKSTRYHIARARHRRIWNEVDMLAMALFSPSLLGESSVGLERKRLRGLVPSWVLSNYSPWNGNTLQNMATNMSFALTLASGHYNCWGEGIVGKQS
jgi:hypothetical protein